MSHFTEEGQQLTISQQIPATADEMYNELYRFDGVCFLRLPSMFAHPLTAALDSVDEVVEKVVEALGRKSTLIIFGEVIDLVQVHQALMDRINYHLWIAIKRVPIVNGQSNSTLDHSHIGALVYTKYEKSLRHIKTRQHYTYCPHCGKTTKDYGGKKHTYHAQGTLLSDIWRDIEIDPTSNIDVVLQRFADLFGIDDYNELKAFDLSHILTKRTQVTVYRPAENVVSRNMRSQLIHGDVLQELQKLPSNSIDFAFTDPPYNLKKNYHGYADALEIQEYFNWCDAWITEVARVLKPGGTFALLNIPLWSVRHFIHLQTVLNYQNWIVWDALSFPVRYIMPAHYTILCFSKGEPRPLPGLIDEHSKQLNIPTLEQTPAFSMLSPMAEGYCSRASCIKKRIKNKHDDRGLLTDIWWDIHRLKHNSRRVDHPCQLPPQLLYRLISIFTSPGETVLDCFNGAGTTTLCAHQLGRRYIGIELEEQYIEMAATRHKEIEQGIDPFRKEDRILTTKNSSVARVTVQQYEVPKKTLQLEVRRIAQQLGHIPSRQEVIEHGQYPIRYYDEYFSSWGEACAAARHSGMSETQDDYPKTSYSQKRLF